MSAMSCPVEGCSFKTILQERLRDHLIRKHGMTRESAKATVAGLTTTLQFLSVYFS